ncbi:hypothetical protein D9M71_391180 [compost metagenome]
MGEQQAEHADQAGGEVRGIDQAVRDEEAEFLQAGIDGRRGAGEQQHDAGNEHQQRQHRRRHPRGDAQRLLRDQCPADLDHQQQQAGDDQRQHHVDQPVQQQRGGQRRGADLPGEGRQQHRLEHPDAARHVAEHAGGQGDQVDQQEGAERRCLGQQQVEHAGGDGHVQRGDRQLQQRQAQARQADAAAADAHQVAVRRRLLRQAPALDADHQQGAEQQDAERQRRHHPFRQAQRRGCRDEIAERRQCGQRRQCATQREAGEQRHPRHLAGAHAVARIQAIAHRSAGKHRQPHRIADGEGGEAAGQQQRRRQRHPGEAAGGPFIAEHDDEAEHHRRQRADQRRTGNRQHGCVQRIRIDFLEQVITGDEREGEQEEGDGYADGLAVGGKLVQQALPGEMERGVGSRRRVGAHLAPHGVCATDYGPCGEFQVPCGSIFSRERCVATFFAATKKATQVSGFFEFGCGSWI